MAEPVNRKNELKWLAFKYTFVYLLLLLPITLTEGTVRYGMPASYIGVARTKRSESFTTLTVPDEPLSTPSKKVKDTNGPTEGEIPSKRNKRHVTEEDKDHQPEIKVFTTSDSHQQVMIDWAGEGSDVVVCVTRDTTQTKNSASNILISYDYGTTYENKTGLFKMNQKSAIINKLYKNDKFTDRFVFTDVVNKYIHTTVDSGKTINQHKVVFTPSEVSHHPIDPAVLVVYDADDKERKLYVSENFGGDWQIIGRYVKSYYWMDSTSPPTLYIEREEPFGSASVISSQNLFKDESATKTVITSVEDFEVKDEFLFAIKKVHLLGSRYPQPELQLWISYQQGPFLKAEFPTNLPPQHYYIADISEGQIMVCVAHDQFVSNLYVSSVPRSAHHQIRFSLSLERILYFNPTKNWVDTWLSEVADEKFADLHAVGGIRGVFIASQLAANFSQAPKILTLEHLTSYITFDQGGQWKPLQPPRLDVEGNRINCSRADGCSLHLTQELGKLYPANQTKPILSKKSAPGLILATGTVGKSLKGHPALFVSTDAGINWYQVLRGNYLFTFGDHGGILMAVQMYRANGTTDHINYSTDEGETWHKHKFYNESIRVYGLMTEPGENTTIFTIFGSKEGRHEWIFIKVDMKPVFQYLKCNTDDYKTWSSSGGRHTCLLGRKTIFERRVPHSNCFNGVNYDRPISVENCPCDRADFECDYGFKNEMITQKCVQDNTDSIDPYAVPVICSSGQFYNRTKGYRKIPGDSCEGGREYQYKATVTACPVSEEQEFLLVSTRQEIMRYDLVNAHAKMEPLPLPNLRMVIGIDFDMSNNCVYWSDVEEKMIKRMCFDGHHDVEILVDKDMQSVEGLALDWISKNLYFVDGEKKTLEVIRTDVSHLGHMRRTLLDNLDNPRGLAVHPVLGFLYLTDWSESNPMVARTHLDGTNLTVLFGSNVVGWPNGIAIDFHTNRIYFADAKLDYIASSDLDGKSMRKLIVNSDKVMQPFALGIYKNLLFWDDWTAHQVLQADKEFGWGIAPIANFTKKGLVDLKVFGRLSQQGTNACAKTNDSSSPCTYLCMAEPKNLFRCLCPNEMNGGKMDGKNEKCVCPDGSEIQENGTCSSSDNTCSSNFFKCNNGRCIPEQWVCDTDNDCGDSSDENEKECGLQPCESPAWQCKSGRCITANWRCDYDNDCGDGSDEEGCQYAPCPSNTFKCANGRCIHPNWKCDMEDDCRDGSDEVNCTTNLPKHECRGTEFTCGDGRCLPLSWRCDGDNDCSDKSDESNCTNVTCESWQFQCSSKQCIFKSWHCDGENDCQDGSDEKGCSSVTTPAPPPVDPFDPIMPPSNLNCTNLMFRCKNTHCIPFWWKCDGLDDCGDASDEEDCFRPGGNPPAIPTEPPTEKPAHTCQLDHFQCSDMICIWESWVCDGDRDCSNGEDEENCHQTSVCIENKEFMCRRSGGCISRTLLCNGQKDCADGSDEEGCIDITPHAVCPQEYFMCDGGACFELFKKCDGNHECIDFSDENDCTGGKENRTYLVTNFTVSEIHNVSATVKWSVNYGEKVEGIKYQPCLIVKPRLGNPNAWKNYSWTSNSSMTFSDLDPFTPYLLKVYVQKDSKTFPPIKPQEFKTTIGVPSPPLDVNAEQVDSSIKVTWKAPHKPNGPIEMYRVFYAPPDPPKEFEVSGDVNELNLPLLEKVNATSIWVTAINFEFSSKPSAACNFTMKTVDSLIKLRGSPSVNGSAIHLEWEPIPDIDGYMISHNQPESMYLTPEVAHNTTKTEIDITDLAPGMTYLFTLRAFKGKLVGPSVPLKVSTTGEPLKAVKGLHAQVMKNLATNVKLTWDEPAYPQQKLKWRYRIVWLKAGLDFLNQSNVAYTSDVTYVIRGLDACETYLIVVMVEGPIGIGPEKTVEVTTGSDLHSPPKNVRVTKPGGINNTMLITWEPSCPQFTNSSLRYEVVINDTILNRASYYELPSKKGIKQSHEVFWHWGGQYTISLRSALPNARFSKPVMCNGSAIPPPYELTFTEFDQSFYWKPSIRMPKELVTPTNTYILSVSRFLNMTDSRTYSCKSPPLVVSNIIPGVIYYASVVLKDDDGYLSTPSEVLRFEKPISSELVLSQNSVVGVAVSVVIVVIALVSIVVIMAVRHRRLARSFLSFANTHYDRSQGTTLITTDHNLDEDDDSPMIRGFSDDEPMVIA